MSVSRSHRLQRETRWAVPRGQLDGCHRRRVWESFDTAGRCGRWGGLIAAGATLRAHPEPTTITGFSAPPALEVRQERRGIGIVQRTHDPADDEFAALQKASA